MLLPKNIVFQLNFEKDYNKVFVILYFFVSLEIDQYFWEKNTILDLHHYNEAPL